MPSWRVPVWSPAGHRWAGCSAPMAFAGLANVELTPELALAVGVGAVTVLAGVAPDRRRRPGHPALRGAARGGRLRGSGERRGRRRPAGRRAHPRRRLRGRGKRGATSGSCSRPATTPMPDNGIKIFGSGGFKLADEIEDRIEAYVTDPADEAPHRCRRRPAAIRRPGTGRARRGLRPSPAGRAEDPARAAEGRRRLRRGGRVGARAAGAARGRGRGHRYRGRRRWLAYQRRLRRDRDAGARSRPSSPPELMWASRTTATPTAASLSMPRAIWSTATRSWPSLRSRCASAGALAAGHGRLHGDEQPRLPPCHA